MRVGLKQIAEESGCSVPTVSRVLRGDKNYSSATSQRVLDVAERLKYRPNMLVQGMQTGRTGTIGVMIPPQSEYLSKIVMGVHEVLVQHDCVPMLHWSGEDMPELEQLHRLIDRRVDGVILFPHEDAAPDAYLSEVWDRGLPLVTVDRQMRNTHADFAGTEDSYGAELAAEHLLELGHRRFVHLTARTGIGSSKDRYSGFRNCVELVEGASVRRVVADRFRSGYEPAIEFLQASDRPTAVFAANDVLAVAVLKAAADLGLRVPEDLSVVGFADLEIGRVVQPALTTLRQDPVQIGRTAAQLVLDRLEGRVTHSNSVVVLDRPSLVVRESTTHVT